MLKRKGKYYFMWSEGGWGGPDYCVAYAIADSPFGPFKRVGKILQQDPEVATGAGHHSVIQVPGKDREGTRQPRGVHRPHVLRRERIHQAGEDNLRGRETGKGSEEMTY